MRNGVIGVFIGQGALDAVWIQLPASRCRSRSIARARRKVSARRCCFANTHMKGLGGLGLASDFTFTRSATPRFGKDACAGYLAAGTSLSTGTQLLETFLDAPHYTFAVEGRGELLVHVPHCVNGVSHDANVKCGTTRRSIRT